MQGKLVYANYGREEDFEALEKLGVNCSGKIVLMRYGKVGRATKVCTGQQSSMVTILMQCWTKFDGSDRLNPLTCTFYAAMFTTSYRDFLSSLLLERTRSRQ